MRLLLESGCAKFINEKKPEGYTVLHLALFIGSIECVTLLVDHGADLEATNNEGYSALHISIHRRHFALSHLLIERGADIESRSSRGDTVLHKVSQIL